MRATPDSNATSDAAIDASSTDALLAALRDRAAEIGQDGDRALLLAAADTIARVVAAQGDAEARLRERAQHMDLIEEIAALGSWEIDLTTDAIY